MKRKIIVTSLICSFVFSTLVNATDAVSSASESTSSSQSSSSTTTTPVVNTSQVTRVTPVNTSFSENDTKYLIVAGDTLGKIASKYNTTYQKLAQYNGIANPNLIYAGNVIYIPSDEVNTEVVATNDTVDYSGVHVGYSWRGENSGTSFEDSNQRIKTTLTLDENGVILDAEIDFLKKSGDEWIKRDDSSADVTVDFNVEPTVATLGDEKTDGASMFDIKTNDKMSLYVIAVDEDGTVAYGFVDPITRYFYEAKFEAGYNFDTKIGDASIGDTFIPTVLTSTSGYVKPKDWAEVNGQSLFDIDKYSYVTTKRGVYEGLTNESTVRELLEKSGAVFVDGQPQQLEATHGFHSAGGWTGNYEAIAEYLIGKNATEITTLASFDDVSYAGNSYRDSINEDNFFGYNTDTVTTATRTLQDSWDAVSGATVRISREITSYQRALVEAGILSEEDVIKGRF